MTMMTVERLHDLFDEIQSHLEKHGVKKEDYDQMLPPYRED